jgi:predicted Zn-dependent protease
MRVGMRTALHTALPILLTAFLIACSSSGKKPLSVQVPNEVWWQKASISPATCASDKNLAAVRQKMQTVVPFSFTVGFADSTEINAYADRQETQRYVIFTTGFIREFGNDPDVLASVLGHELAHHQLGHTQPGYAKNRDTGINVASQALGVIASYFIPFSGLVVGNVAKGAGLSFSRDDERAADLQGMQWAQQAGYSACGSYRFAARMNAIGEGASFAFLSTHPGNAERMQNAETWAQSNRAAPCSSSPIITQSSDVIK